MSNSQLPCADLDAHVMRKGTFRSPLLSPESPEGKEAEMQNSASSSNSESKGAGSLSEQQEAVSPAAMASQSAVPNHKSNHVEEGASITAAAQEPAIVDSSDARYENMIQGLIDFQRQHNSLQIPRGYRWNNRNLYEFCRNQRKHYLNGLRGKTPALLPKRIARLRSIGFELDPTGVQGHNDAFDDRRWAVMFQGLHEFYTKHGSGTIVPTGYLCDNKSLHDWCRHQRKQYSTIVDGKPVLSAERIKRLRSIGFDLDPTNRRQDSRSESERWESMFQALLEFRRQFGSFSIPEGYMHDGRSLSSWIQNQRRLYTNHLKHHSPALLPERAMRLEAIGFDLMPRRSSTNSPSLKRKSSNDSSECGDAAEGVEHAVPKHPAWSGQSTPGAVAQTYPSHLRPNPLHMTPAWVLPLVNDTIAKYQAMSLEERLQIVKSFDKSLHL
ncbi:hypothetical protein MPSEU_000049400 [Mayamaea pseudoterrestris]|nr:hypothetical protein MPSEU_000049400 [Mayamaea pseudoterrestris]